MVVAEALVAYNCKGSLVNRLHLPHLLFHVDYGLALHNGEIFVTTNCHTFLVHLGTHLPF